MIQPRRPASPCQPVAKAWILLALVGAMVAALVVRSLGVADVFLSDDMVLLGLNDGAYHARRAYYSFVNFPSILYFDPYMAFPDGSPVPWPPLYDWVIAGVAKIFGSSAYVFESVAAWASAFFATLTVIPVYALGRCLLGARGGLAAAFVAPMPYAQRLHRGDGFLGGDPVGGACFRLVTEGPERGTPSRAMFASRPKFEFVPYKLFGRVAGAQIEVAARPGVTVEVELDLQTTQRIMHAPPSAGRVCPVT